MVVFSPFRWTKVTPGDLKTIPLALMLNLLHFWFDVTVDVMPLNSFDFFVLDDLQNMVGVSLEIQCCLFSDPECCLEFEPEPESGGYIVV